MAEPINETNPIKTESIPPPPQVEQNRNRESNHSRKKQLLSFTFFLLLLGLLWLAYWFFYLQYHESTDDAYANGNLMNINSVINGAVVAFFADDTDLVKEGQLLVQLDRTNYQVNYDEDLATLASITLQVRQLYKNIQTNRSLVENKRSIVERERSDYKSRLELRLKNPRAEAEEDFIHASQNYLAAHFDLLAAESQLQTALAAAGNTAPENHPLIEQQKNKVRFAFYQLEHCSIYAPTTGYVAQRSVDVGRWITPSTNLMAIIPTNDVWVDANFKETQLGLMRVGQPATVWFDLYGSKIQYAGNVLGIASGTGSVFSLIPPQNATGNWIKIVQRLPVRISIDSEKIKEYPIRLGISANVDVDITEQNLPFLVQTPPTTAVATTNVFDIDLEKVDRLMDSIIFQNLKEHPQEQNGSTI